MLNRPALFNSANECAARDPIFLGDDHGQAAVIVPKIAGSRHSKPTSLLGDGSRNGSFAGPGLYLVGQILALRAARRNLDRIFLLPFRPGHGAIRRFDSVVILHIALLHDASNHLDMLDRSLAIFHLQILM